MTDATASVTPARLPELFALLAAHRPACRQERTYARGVARLLGGCAPSGGTPLPHSCLPWGGAGRMGRRGTAWSAAAGSIPSG